METVIQILNSYFLISRGISDARAVRPILKPNSISRIANNNIITRFDNSNLGPSRFVCVVFLLPTSRCASLETRASDEPRNAIKPCFVMDALLVLRFLIDAALLWCKWVACTLFVKNGTVPRVVHARLQACTLDQAVSLHTSTGHRRT